MIVKKVPASKAAAPKSRAANVRALCDYIAGLAAGGDGEKIEHRSAFNLLNIDHESQVQEMIDLAEVARRGARPVQHWIMSWREGEQPTAAQAEDAVRIFLGELGLSEHQAIYALHRDTHNWHLHLAVNRVHPETEKVVTVNGGFDHEIAHRAIARIERVQGWRREDNGLFIVQPDGSAERLRARPEQERRPSVQALGHEERTGERSAERIAIDDGAPIIRRARSWREVHEGLVREGIRFEKKGSGALLWIGEQPVKASSAGRDCSMSALQKRLGEYEHQPARDAPEMDRRKPESIEVGSSRWEGYRDARAAHEARRSAARERTAAQQRDEWRRLTERHRRERDQIFRRSWKGKGDVLNATRSVIAAGQAQEKAELRDRQQRERAALRKQRELFAGYEEWLAKTNPERANEWRHRERRAPSIEGSVFEQPAARDIRAFKAVVDGPRVHYHLAGSRRGPAFTDRGKTIEIRDTQKEAVLAALQLSAQKWGTFTVEGGDEFRSSCVEFAAEHGFKIANPELQQAIAAEREAIAAERQRLAAPRFSEPRDTLNRREGRPATTRGDAYQRHRDELRQHHAREHVHASRLDAEIAVRLRLTGHSRSEIAKAIQTGASVDRANEKRNWNRYAERTADFAFGIPGQRLADRLNAQVDRFFKIEGRQRNEPEPLRPSGPFSRWRL